MAWIVAFFRLFFSPVPPVPPSCRRRPDRHDFDFVWERDAW